LAYKGITGSSRNEEACTANEDHARKEGIDNYFGPVLISKK